MFQSYSYANGKWIIIDSDFQESVNYNNKYLVEDIIEVYSKRNLNVALNIVLFMQYRYKEYNYSNNYSIDKQISDYKEYVKDFNKYIPEINKYLSLI